jgi:hypothetical protein
MTVERMRTTISNREYVQWRAIANVREARREIERKQVPGG